MTCINSTGRLVLLIGVIAIALLVFPFALAQEDKKIRLKVQVKKLIYAEQCQGCHNPDNADYKAWQLTKHAKSVNVLEGDRSDEITEKLDIDDATSDSLCVTCHGTPKIVDDSVELASGVSCEMCHGAGRDWYKIHGDKQLARDKRIAQSVAAGMVRPENLYQLARNCMGCHSVQQEQLVNKGGHHPGSAAFELVAWSQGEVRHNFNVEKGHKSNDESPIGRRRKMFVVGQLVNLEFGLTGLSLANSGGPYAVAMIARIGAARKQIDKICAAATGVTLQTEIAALLKGVALKHGNAKALAEAAGKVATLSKAFARSTHKPDLSAIDALLPKTYKGTVYTSHK